MRRVLAILALAILTASCATPAQRQGPYDAVRARRNEMAQALAEQISMCFARNDTTNPVFHGCVDWHSAAHGGWALTTYERLTHDRRYESEIRNDFSRDGIVQELAHLRADPSFERPYGRAWFLRLAVDWRKLRPGDDRFDDLATEAAESIVSYYEANAPDPTAQEYQNPSWALINVLYYARAKGDRALAHRVERLVWANFLEPHCDIALESRGFIAVCTTWAWLVSEVLPSAEFHAWYARWNPGIETLTPVVTFNNAHDYGRNFSRAWGLYHLAGALGDARLGASYVAHVQAGFEPRNQWSGEYMVNGHWVAQFGMLAIEPMFDDHTADMDLLRP